MTQWLRVTESTHELDTLVNLDHVRKIAISTGEIKLYKKNWVITIPNDDCVWIDIMLLTLQNTGSFHVTCPTMSMEYVD